MRDVTAALEFGRKNATVFPPSLDGDFPSIWNMKISVSPSAVRLIGLPVLLGLTLFTGSASAAPTASEMPAPQVSTPPPAPPPSPSYNSSSYESLSSSSSYSNYSDRSDAWSRSEPRDSVTYIERVLPIYFPPIPPVLGMSVPTASTSSSRSMYFAPAELQDYVSEYFYPALGSRLTLKILGSGLRTKVEAYRARKTELQNELRGRIDDLRTADPATRERELVALATAQLGKITALEKTAEQLRNALVRGDWLQMNVDWNSSRSWVIGSSRFTTPYDEANARHQLIQAAAFYERGLLPEQRGLLRELAIEQRETGWRGRQSNEGAAPPLFFSPATARLRLPKNLPPNLTKKISFYEQEKTALKEELREMVYAQDQAFFAGSRTRAYEALGDRQWPRLAALEELAEEIRRDFALLPEPIGPPSLPSLSTALTAQISSYLAEKKSIEEEILDRLNDLRRKFGAQRVFSDKGARDIRLTVSAGPQRVERLVALQIALADLNRDLHSKQTGLQRELEKVYEGLKREKPEVSAKAVEPFLDQWAATLQQRDDWSRYSDYQIAMLMPGLLPEQRRLLYDGGVQQLELPLPSWDRVKISVVR